MKKQHLVLVPTGFVVGAFNLTLEPNPTLLETIMGGWLGGSAGFVLAVAHPMVVPVLAVSYPIHTYRLRKYETQKVYTCAYCIKDEP